MIWCPGERGECGVGEKGGGGKKKSSDVAGEADSRCSPSCKISATERGEGGGRRRGWKVTAVLARCRR